MEDENWYDKNIEKPLQELVKYLRNNGVNTECSCGHELYIQCQYVPDGDVKEIQTLIYNWLCEHNEKINFEIKAEIKVLNGNTYPTLNIKLNPNFGTSSKKQLIESIEYHKKMIKYYKNRIKNKLYGYNL